MVRAKWLWLSVLSVVTATPAAAQMFGTGSVPTVPASAAVNTNTASPDEENAKPAEDGITLETLTQTQGDGAVDPAARISQIMNGEVSAETQTSAESAVTEDEEDIFIPEGELYRLNTPTADGSERGGQAFVAVDEQGRMKKTEKIFLFYDEFKVSGQLGGMAVCDVRFNILSNLDRKINQLDIKLVWPGITTTLSFADIAPNTQTYYNYSLMGEGCYNMDKAPNIIVNRCRVRGMTASECAGKLVWLSR